MVAMDLFSAEKERRKQRQINQYLSTRYHYSAKGRKDAVRFERRRAIRRRAAALAKLSEELTRCQAVYLNCLHQAGTAHRLAQLIEKVEQIAVSDAQSAQKSNPQGNSVGSEARSASALATVLEAVALVSNIVNRPTNSLRIVRSFCGPSAVYPVSRSLFFSLAHVLAQRIPASFHASDQNSQRIPTN